MFLLEIQTFSGNLQLKVSLHAGSCLVVLDPLLLLLKLLFHLLDLELRLAVKFNQLELVLFVCILGFLLVSLDSFCIPCGQLFGLVELVSLGHLHLGFYPHGGDFFVTVHLNEALR